jgi:hypothetical protein
VAWGVHRPRRGRPGGRGGAPVAKPLEEMDAALVEELGGFLQRCGCGHVLGLLVENEVDLSALQYFQEDDFLELDIPGAALTSIRAQLESDRHGGGGGGNDGAPPTVVVVSATMATADDAMAVMVEAQVRAAPRQVTQPLCTPPVCAGPHNSDHRPASHH